MINVYKIISSNGQMDRLHFRESFALTFGILDDTMLDRIFFYFDGDNQGTVCFCRLHYSNLIIAIPISISYPEKLKTIMQ